MKKKFGKRRNAVLERFLNNNDLGKLLLRVSVGMLLLFHGINKLQHGYNFVETMLVKAKLSPYFSHGILAGELFAPLLMVLGYYTRPAALLQVVVMIMAVYLVHSHDLLTFSEHGGYALELQALYFFGSLAVFFLGAGRYSISRGNGLWN